MPVADVAHFPARRIVRNADQVAVTHRGETTTYASPEDLAHAVLLTPHVQAKLKAREAEAIRHAISRLRADEARLAMAERRRRRDAARRAWARLAQVALAAGAVAGLFFWAVA